jgi:hypothetical protein
MPLTGAQAFMYEIRDVTGSTLGKKDAPGKTLLIGEALKAFEESVTKGQAQAEQVAYLFEAFKQCNKWLKLKEGKTSGHTPDRRRIIQRVRDEITDELETYPLVGQALNRFETRKANATPPTNPRSPFGVYAHERTRYEKLKAAGQFHDPHLPRFTPGATKLGGTYSNLKYALPDGDKLKQKKFKNKAFKDFTFADYHKLDVLTGCQYKVLYLSKLQRLRYMLDINGQGEFVSAVDDSLVHLGDEQVGWHIGTGGVQHQRPYAIDVYGNLFVASDQQILQDVGLTSKQTFNHTTLCAGNDVLCAGTISIKKGKLRAITNNSGHYQPTTAHLLQVVTMLNGQGVSMTGVVVWDKQTNLHTEGRKFLNGEYGQSYPGMNLQQLLKRT